MKRFFLPLLPVLAMLTGCGTTATAPGTYKDWEGELDSVTIVQRFHLSTFTRILVLPIDAHAIKLPDNQDTRSSIAAIVDDATKHFAEKLQTKLPDRAHLTVSTATADTDLRRNAGALVIRTRFALMDAGSMTGRMFSGGFGGKTRITLEGEIIDGGSGRTLATFSKTNSKGSGVGPYGFINMNTLSLESNEDEIIESVGELLKAFYP